MSSITEYQSYRPSASLIIATKTLDKDDFYDYRLLLVKRTEHTSYAPDHCVFPGGVFSIEADESLEWLKYFNDFGIRPELLKQLEICNGNRPVPLMTSGQNFTRDISLRITALRETFEEVGILLCRNSQNLNDLQGYGHFYEQFYDRAHWQHVVHNDPKAFIKLCQYLNVVPDLWSLHEWSVWRSPIKADRKFDTVFYFVSVKDQPHLLLERNEIQEALWHSPTTFLQYFRQRTIWLPPMQVYELSRLTHAHSWQALLEFAYKRNWKGSTLLMPVYYHCTDGIIGTLTGDDLYPADPGAHKETMNVDYTVDELHQQAKCLHRLVFYDMYDQCVELNIPPIDGHLSPVKEINVDSKL